LLINHRSLVLTQEAALKQVWTGQRFITARTVDVHIAWLRQKLEDNPKAPR
jgi:two-component system, OmpR family, alkaline phosphatase synthesis response regulator PhoP